MAALGDSEIPKRNEHGAGPDDIAWTPPDVADALKAAFGSSIVEEFVAGHRPSDVLRELAQNEFDAGGTKLIVRFCEDHLEVQGNGKNIDASGWNRLSVLMGTGRVVGNATLSTVAAKENGLGSKNFGLRSLFLFGNKIYVRSGGKLILLDLEKLGTAHANDPSSRKQKGVGIYVPYRTETLGILAPFDRDREEDAFNAIATDLLSALIKLVVPGSKQNLSTIVISSARLGRELHWTQKATPAKGMRKFKVFKRVASLNEVRPALRKSQTEEIEFRRTVDIPAEYGSTRFPSYFKAGRGKLCIAVSVPVKGNQVDLSACGGFYYPLGANNAATGTAISVSAPFRMNEDRSRLIDDKWNLWLSDQAAEFVQELLADDWYKRFGAKAYLALQCSHAAAPDWFSTRAVNYLQEGTCWPTSALDGKKRHFARAKDVVIPTDPALRGFIDGKNYLDPDFEKIEAIRDILLGAGAKRFTLNSLVRLRSGSSNANFATKLSASEANYHFTEYKSALQSEIRQVTMAEALTKLAKNLSATNKTDLAETESTLASDGSLKSASELVRVAPEIWSVCPAPLSSRLHEILLDYKAIAGLCRKFDNDQWVRTVATKIRNSAATDDERDALYRYLISHGDQLKASLLASIKTIAVVRDHRGDWIAPTSLTSRETRHFSQFEPVLHAPGNELLRAKKLLRRLRIRTKISGPDLVRYAAHVQEHPALASGFEETLVELLPLLTSRICSELRSVSFLETEGDALARPSRAYQRTRLNILCLGDSGTLLLRDRASLYRRLGCPEQPSWNDLIAAIERWAVSKQPPPVPNILYPALARAAHRDGKQATAILDQKILWVGSEYHRPRDTLIGPRIPSCLAIALPHLKAPDAQCKAYVELGASYGAMEHHWREFFLSFGHRHKTGSLVSASERKALLSAYKYRGDKGTPDNIEELAPFLLDDKGAIYALSDILNGFLVENDFPELAESLKAAKTNIAFALVNEDTTRFFIRVGVKRLTDICGKPNFQLGVPLPPPQWFRRDHEERIITTLHRPLIARALADLSRASRPRHEDNSWITTKTLRTKLQHISRIRFYKDIQQTYRILGKKIEVAAEHAIEGESACFLVPSSIRELDHLLAGAVAELLGPRDVSDRRSLTAIIFGLLQCATDKEISTYLRRQGIAWQSTETDEEAADGIGEDQEADHVGNISENLVRGLVDGLSRGESTATNSKEAPPPPSGPIRPRNGTKIELPPLEGVTISVVGQSAGWQPPVPGSSRGGGASWTPPSARDVEQDQMIGQRGEELVYRMEVERLRAIGHEEPEALVIWSSQTNPTSDHDIQSIGADGKPIWIEVKATTGIDGRFEWAKREFEKALREGARYELWRVYEAHTAQPTAKCFRNPVSLLNKGGLRLDLGTLRAILEPKNPKSE